MNIALLIAGAVVVVGLVALLARTLLQLRAQRRRESETTAAQAEHNQREHDQRLKSLEMISLAALAGDCELSEACIRVRQLLMNYPGLRSAPEYAPIEAMYAEVRRFDTGDDRRALPSAEVDRQDEARLEIEGRHRPAVLASLRTLRSHATALAGSRYDIAVATGTVERAA